MKRRELVKLMGMSAFAVSTSGFTIIEQKGKITTECATSRDMMGPYYRKNAPVRNDLTYTGNDVEIALKVCGKIYGIDCQQALSNIEIDIWHCDHNKRYDMKSDEYKCRGKLKTDKEGAYWFKTFVPPPYEGRPKHIHYMIHETQTYQRLVTQLYFQGDDNLDTYSWMFYPRDERRILNIYKNEEGLAEVELDLFLQTK